MTFEALHTHSLGYNRRSTPWIMLQVMLALVPGTLAYALIVNPKILANLAIAVSSALVFEALMLRLRGRTIMATVRDGSILLAAWLLALCLPPDLPAWQVVIGTFILCTLGKHLFGGLGHNPFNPAMVAYAMLLVSFPVTMTQWDEISAPATTVEWDSVTGATALDKLRNIRQTVLDDDSAAVEPDDVSALFLSSDLLWVNAGWLLGGLYLLLRRIISWHIPIAVLGTVFVLYAAAGTLSEHVILPAFASMVSGAMLLGAFFIATDPVSSASSRWGKLIYGAGIGMLCFVIREFSIYPEGFAFAVLLMNLCVPLLDHLFTRS
ncbi:MAG: RnfABCDGE type electron transport complex subunit D [Granulosicoccus sp.]